MHHWAAISDEESPTPMLAQEKRPAYGDDLSERYWSAFCRLDGVG